MENEIKCIIIADGPDLECWVDPNPVEKEKFENRLSKLIGGCYTVDEYGRCIIEPQPWDPQTPFGNVARGVRGGETCIKTEHKFGDITVKVEICKAH